MKLYKFLGVATLTMITLSCKQDIITLQQPTTTTPPTVTPTKGSADFTKFVALGNSLSAGYQAGALFNAGQQNSYPAMLAQQFSLVGGGSFNQPNINSVNGFYTGGTNPVGNVVLGRLLLQGTPPAPKPTISDAGAIPNPQVNPSFIYSGDTTKLNNFSVPGIVLGQILTPKTGDWTLAGSDPAFNPFYARFASQPGKSTILGDAIRKQPTFFSFDLGDNDVLGYAVTGGDGSVPITDQGTFTFLYNAAISKLLGYTNAKGVLSTIPNVVIIPYFTTITWNYIPLDQATAASLTTNLANNYNAFLDGMVAKSIITSSEAAKRKLTYVAGKNNAILISDETLTDLSPYMAGPYAGLLPYKLARQTTSSDLIPLSAGSILGTLANPNDPTTVYGVAVPLGDKYALIPSETSAILTAIAGFNATINSIASANSSRLAVADINAEFTSLAQARVAVYNGVAISPTLAPPTGAFSEDGVHPNTRGYAFFANVIIKAINAKFGSTLPLVDLSSYPGTALPINP